MKILVTGTEGYIGSLLAPVLMQRGHEVLGIDTGFYKVEYNGAKLFAFQRYHSRRFGVDGRSYG